MAHIYLSKKSTTYIPAGTIDRSDLIQDDLQVYNVNLIAECRKADGTLLPTTPDGTNLGLTAGTFGAASPMLIGSTSNNNAKSEITRIFLELPPEYQSGQTVTIRIHSRVDVVRQVSATVDVVCYEADKEAGIGADLCTTAAQSINSATWADKDFTITPTGLVAGDILDIEITGASDDTGAGAPSNGHCEIGAIQLLLDIKG